MPQATASHWHVELFYCFPAHAHFAPPCLFSVTRVKTEINSLQGCRILSKQVYKVLSVCFKSCTFAGVIPAFNIITVLKSQYCNFKHFVISWVLMIPFCSYKFRKTSSASSRFVHHSWFVFIFCEMGLITTAIKPLEYSIAKNLIHSMNNIDTWVQYCLTKCCVTLLYHFF